MMLMPGEVPVKVKAQPKGGVREMTAIVLAVVAAVCALGWLTRYISTAVLLWYLQEKRISPPSEEDMMRGAK